MVLCCEGTIRRPATRWKETDRFLGKEKGEEWNFYGMLEFPGSLLVKLVLLVSDHTTESPCTA